MERTEIYVIIDNFDEGQWSKFVRTRLELEDQLLDHITNNPNLLFEEKKYQATQSWLKKEGNDLDKLRKLKHDFFCNNWTPKVPESDSEKNREGAIQVQSGDDILGETDTTSRYDLTEKKGCLLIISNSFSHTQWYNSRDEGVKKDIEKMCTLWKDKLGCQLYRGKAHKDKSAKEMKNLLEGLSQTADYDYVVTIISTHGGIVPEEWTKRFEPGGSDVDTDDCTSELMACLQKVKDPNENHAITEVMLGNDERPLRLREMKRLFYNNKAKGLHDMPKFLILGYCRGDLTDHGVLKDSQPAQSQALPQYNQPFLETLMPTVSDVLIVYSTHELYKSYENYDGTWLISAIYEVFTKCHGEKHVVDMLTMVNKVMKTKGGTIEGKFCKAMSIYESSLVKDFYLS